MTWKVKDVVSQRIELVIRVIKGGEAISQVSEDLGVSRVTAHLWLKRYREAQTFTALEDRSRAPLKVANRTKDRIVKRVLELRSLERWSGRKIQTILSTEGISIGSRTIDRILKREGCIREQDENRPAVKRFEREKPNQLWQMDFKGQYKMATGGVCYPLSILDDHSRYAVGLYALTSTALEPVEACLVETFQRFGLPDRILMDHGTPWWSSTAERGLTRLSVMLIQQGIRLSFSGVRHPQTQGKVERFHRTLSESLIHRDLPQQFQHWQARLDQFRSTYNDRRPHEALKMRVPKDCYQPSRRAYSPRPPDFTYSSEWTVLETNSQGSISFRDRRYFICRALANQLVAVQEIDGTVLVRFRKMYVRELDLRTGETRALMANVEDGNRHLKV